MATLVSDGSFLLFSIPWYTSPKAPWPRALHNEHYNECINTWWQRWHTWRGWDCLCRPPWDPGGCRSLQQTHSLDCTLSSLLFHCHFWNKKTNSNSFSIQGLTLNYLNRALTASSRATISQFYKRGRNVKTYINLFAPGSLFLNPILFLWYWVSGIRKSWGEKYIMGTGDLHKHMQRSPIMAASTMQPITSSITNITGTS